MDNIGSRISKFIEETEGLTKTKFADTIGVSQAFVSQMCSGVRVPSDRTITDICTKFNISEQWLRTGEGDMIVKMSINDELAAFTGKLQREDSFRKRFISVLSTLDTEDWIVLEKIADELLRRQSEEQKKTDP